VDDVWSLPALPVVRNQSFPNIEEPSFATQASAGCDFSSLKNRRSSPSDYQNSESREKSGRKPPVCGVEEFRLVGHVLRCEFSQNPSAFNEAPGTRGSRKTQNSVVSGISLNSLR